MGGLNLDKIVVNNKPDISKAIVLMGHSDYGEDVDDVIRQGAENEKANGKFPNHVLFGNKTTEKKRRKHNFLVDGAPVCVHYWSSLMHSSIDEAVIIGNEDTQTIYNAFTDVFSDQLSQKKWTYVLEEGGLGANVALAKKNMEIADNELTALLLGDTPLMWDINSKIIDPAVASYDAVFNLNSRELLGTNFPRNFHLRIQSEGSVYNVKEPHVFPVNLSKLDLQLLDVIFSGRRTYVSGGNKKSKGTGRKGMIKNLFFAKGKWRKTARALGFFGVYAGLKHKLFGKKDEFTLRDTQLGALAYVGSGMKTKIRVTNADPASIIDIDSAQDLDFANHMYHQVGDKKSLNPHYDDIETFKNECMSALQKTVPLLSDYEGFLNDFHARFDLEKPFAGGEYRPVFFSRQVIAQAIKHHQEYNRSALAFKP